MTTLVARRRAELVKQGLENAALRLSPETLTEPGQTMLDRAERNLVGLLRSFLQRRSSLGIARSTRSC